MSATPTIISATPLADALKLGEDRYTKLMQLESNMRKGFVGLSGMRLSSNSLMFGSDTWPVKEQAEIRVDVESWSLKDSAADSDASLRVWFGGLRPSKEAAETREAFKRVVRLALELVSPKER